LAGIGFLLWRRVSKEKARVQRERRTPRNGVFGLLKRNGPILKIIFKEKI